MQQEPKVLQVEFSWTNNGAESQEIKLLLPMKDGEEAGDAALSVESLPPVHKFLGSTLSTAQTGCGSPER